MSTPQAAAPTPQRPPLPLGPMTGDREYVKERSENLCRTFAALLDADIKLEDTTEVGKTDCHSTIWAPLWHPEGYLTVEHELSHWLFETDLALAQAFGQQMVSKLLNRAGFKPGTNEALPYEHHLGQIIHGLWNILEDWRCCWLWGELYAGGAELLQQRWHDISKYEIPDEAGEESLLKFLMRFSAGVETQNAKKEFQDCKPPMQRALNLVEGVDAAACLGITARLIDEIMDELLANNPPPPPQKSSGGGGGKGRAGQSRKRKRGRQSPGAKKKKEQQQQMQHILKLLCSAVPRRGRFSPDKKGQNGQLGEPSVVPGKKRSRQGALSTIKRVMNADDKSSDDSGLTPFQLLLHTGAQAMEARLEAAQQAMLRNQDSPEEQQNQLLLGATKIVGIRVVHVTPSRPLPPPTSTGYENRRILEQLRMVKKKRKSYEGELDAGELIDALGTGELDRPLYTEVKRIPKFELLFLFDLSGSMTTGQALPLTERALADSVFAVRAIRSKAEMWGFSDVLYVYDELGSPLHTSGVSHGCTSMVQALDVAHRWGKRHVSTRAVMLVTDGLPTSCRAYNSTGNPTLDLRDVLNEMRRDKLPLGVLAIRHLQMSFEDTINMYNEAFGKGNYGVVSSFDELATQLPVAVRVLAESHVVRGVSRQ